MTDAPINLEIRGRGGLLVLSGRFAVVHREYLPSEDRICLVGQAEAGFRVSLTIPCAVLEDVAASPRPEEIGPAARRAEDRVLEAHRL